MDREFVKNLMKNYKSFEQYATCCGITYYERDYFRSLWIEAHTK